MEASMVISFSLVETGCVSGGIGYLQCGGHIWSHHQVPLHLCPGFHYLVSMKSLIDVTASASEFIRCRDMKRVRFRDSSLFRTCICRYCELYSMVKKVLISTNVTPERKLLRWNFRAGSARILMKNWAC